MAKTVDELRNEIRVSIGRFERELSAAFTKEDIAALCERVGCEIDRERLPSKSQMRADILSEISARNDNEHTDTERPFRKKELESIVVFLDDKD